MLVGRRLESWIGALSICAPVLYPALARMKRLPERNPALWGYDPASSIIV
jgi:hypothetical protein